MATEICVNCQLSLTDNNTVQSQHTSVNEHQEGVRKTNSQFKCENQLLKRANEIIKTCE